MPRTNLVIKVSLLVQVPDTNFQSFIFDVFLRLTLWVSIPVQKNSISAQVGSSYEPSIDKGLCMELLQSTKMSLAKKNCFSFHSLFLVLFVLLLMGRFLLQNDINYKSTNRHNALHIKKKSVCRENILDINFQIAKKVQREYPHNKQHHLN